MRSMLWVWVSTCGLLAQQPAPPAPKPAAAPVVPQQQTGGQNAGRVAVVTFDQNGFPQVADDLPPGAAVAPPAPAGEVRVADQAAARATAATAVPASVPASAAAGFDAGTPLLPMFSATGSPGAWKRLGGVQVTWRITVYDPQGAVLGTREVVHTADTNFAARDRLEFPGEGRCYGRLGPSVFAERQGRPWPTWTETAGHELALFGMHLRLPWLFADTAAFAATSGGVVDRPDERLQRLLVERRPPLGLDAIGPDAEPPPRDRFELCFEPSGGRPRELVHRFAFPGSGARTVLFDEWEEYRGVWLARRRIYVDEQRRPTTMLQILAIESAVVTERDFRLH
ncbi:MAG: hypothetical protein JNK49_14910 [Planctomycetes bacterium]|nr:hypothetical protein [Planctomycetota bacterium]